MSIEIRHRYTGAVLHTVQADSLRGANLCRADLSEADLAGANLTRADLAGASLARADLAGASLARADLAGASLARADLTRATLSGADLAGAILSGAIGLLDAGQDTRGYRWVAVRHDDGPRIAAGCRWFTLPEARGHWSTAHKDRPSVAAECRMRLAFLEALCRNAGWPMGVEVTSLASSL